MALQAMTDDGRAFAALTWRDLPLTLLTQTVTPGWGGHEGAWVSGRIDTIEKFGDVVFATGVFNDDEDGEHAAELLANESLTGISMDALGAGEWRCTEYETIEDPWGVFQMCVDGLLFYEEATIMAATQCATPAFGACRMEIVPDDEPEEDAAAAVARMVDAAKAALVPIPDLPDLPSEAAAGYEAARSALVASVAAPTEFAPPLEPPAHWFDVPEPDFLVPLHVLPDGQVFGHIAAAGECHIGFPDVCVVPPNSENDYAYFHLGTVVARDAAGEAVEVRVGQVTLATGHADLHSDMRAALAHYDNTATAVADVRVVDGKHGPWACGAARPSMTPEQVRVFNATGPSGDWRPIRGKRELVAVLMVNVPGFPLVASAVDSIGDGKYRQGALVAGLPSRPAVNSGVALIAAVRRENAELRSRVEILELRVEQLLAAGGQDAIFDALVASVDPKE